MLSSTDCVSDEGNEVDDYINASVSILSFRFDYFPLDKVNAFEKTKSALSVPLLGTSPSKMSSI